MGMTPTNMDDVRLSSIRTAIRHRDGTRGILGKIYDRLTGKRRGYPFRVDLGNGYHWAGVDYDGKYIIEPGKPMTHEEGYETHLDWSKMR